MLENKHLLHFPYGYWIPIQYPIVKTLSAKGPIGRAFMERAINILFEKYKRPLLDRIGFYL